VLTHPHSDHTDHTDRYPNARISVQRGEYNVWRSPLAHRGAKTHLHRADDLDVR
jgi:hypothetical protein